MTGQSEPGSRTAISYWRPVRSICPLDSFLSCCWIQRGGQRLGPEVALRPAVGGSTALLLLLLLLLLLQDVMRVSSSRKGTQGQGHMKPAWMSRHVVEGSQQRMEGGPEGYPVRLGCMERLQSTPSEHLTGRRAGELQLGPLASGSRRCATIAATLARLPCSGWAAGPGLHVWLDESWRGFGRGVDGNGAGCDGGRVESGHMRTAQASSRSSLELAAELNRARSCIAKAPRCRQTYLVRRAACCGAILHGAAKGM